MSFKVINKLNLAKADINMLIHQEELGIKKVGREIVKPYTEYTGGWKAENKPRFSYKWKNEDGSLSATVQIKGNCLVFNIVNHGAKAHRIPLNGNNNPPLAFSDGPYHRGSSGKSTKFGKPSRTGRLIRRVSVNHPGVQGINFDQQIMDDPATYELVESTMREYIMRGLKKMGLKQI